MIDAHVHVWRIGANRCTWPTPELAALYRDFTLDDWRAAAGPSTVEGVILVQTQEDTADTEWLLELADDPIVQAVIGWADLHAADAPAAIAQLARRSKLRGLRPMVQGRAAEWYDDPALEPAWGAMAEAGLVLDALVRPAHLPSLTRLAERHPVLPIVIDHAAKPVLGDLVGWHRDLADLAAHPQVRCKLSGLLTERAAGSRASAIEPAVTILLALFGPDRLIWGSDWPVLTMAGDYRGWLEQARALVPAEQHDAVFGGTARATYGIAA